MAKVSLRNVKCDYYMERPNGFNRQFIHSTARVPVIRIWGILYGGQKCCVHVHGVFPYIIVRTSTPFTREFGVMLRNKITTIVTRNDKRRNLNAENAIYDFIPLSAKSMYGYHKTNDFFVKILFYNPLYVKFVTDALQKMTSQSAFFQVYEAHVPYILQFFIDYAIFGMDLVHFELVKFRVSPQRDFSEMYYGDLTVENITNNTELLSPLMPVTNLPVECDVQALHILNPRLRLQSKIANPGLDYIWKDEQRRCRLRGTKLEAESSQEERLIPETARAVQWLHRLRLLQQKLDPDVAKTAYDDVNATFIADFSAISEPSSAEISDAGQHIFDELFLHDNLNFNDSDEGDSEQDHAEDVDFGREISEIHSERRLSTKRIGRDSVRKRPDPLIMTVSDDEHSDIDVEEFVFCIPSGSKEAEISNLDSVSQKSSQGSASSQRSKTSITSQRSDRSGDMFENRSDDECPCLESACASSSDMLVSLSNPTQSTETSMSKYESFTLHSQKDQEGAQKDCLESFEFDIESVWMPKCANIQSVTNSKCNLNLDCWLCPVEKLPLRSREMKRPAACQNILESFDSVATEVSSEAVISKKQQRIDAFTEQASFISYGGINEGLAVTYVQPSEPATRAESEQSDIRHLCAMSMEILALVRPGMPVPDPQCDEVIGIFYSVSPDICVQEGNCSIDGAILCIDDSLIHSNQLITVVHSEGELFDIFTQVVKKYDPDIVVGYNTTKYSWGYLMERSLIRDRNLLSELSRCSIDVESYYRPGLLRVNKWTVELDPTPAGRLLLNVWRIMRFEIALRSYTLSSVVNAVLKRRFPEYTYSTLTEWIVSENQYLIKLVVDYMQMAARLSLAILSELDMFTKVAEMARVYGIQFDEVLKRGSQFRVESMMLRLARRGQYVAPSVSVAQRKAMSAPESLPLTMEPESGYYRDPVIVLDFQSLYPSIMIAYNYCFTTCLGKVQNIEKVAVSSQFIELGGIEYYFKINDFLAMLKDGQLEVSPNGAVFCHKNVRRGLMPLMLDELLNTRIMVKKAMKKYKDDRRLTRILDARQLALKLIANVTYGYAAANFSGRMPCVEVADAIVSKGRETLERAITHINTSDYCGARVIYGDTDSMFVLCPGSTRQEAFEIGKRIADNVTNVNPNPVKLKLEKVMHPLILEAKKRYVGMSYETADDHDGVFDAKGIETVRRDSCPLVSRILEKSLRKLFQNNLGGAVRYLDIQLSNLEHLPLSDFIFSREYRKTYAATAVVASKKIAEKRRAICARDEPEVGERVPYVIISGEPHCTLISCVREPREYIADHRMTLNFEYYVEKQVLPSIQRAFDYVPLQIEWHSFRKTGCYKCHALGVSLWCKSCEHEANALKQAIIDRQKEMRLTAKLDRLCRECLALRSLRIDYSKCVNMACTVTQKRINIARSLAEKAVKSHCLKRSSADDG